LADGSPVVAEIPATEAAETFPRTQMLSMTADIPDAVAEKFDANTGGVSSELGERRYLSVII
jgi:hypothetical protein